jgi:hypothetical protein
MSESKEEAASKLRNGKVHYVSALNSNVVYRSTSWMLSRSGMFAAICIVFLLYFMLVELLMLVERLMLVELPPGVILLAVFPLPVSILVVLLPRFSQWFRTIDYYGLPFSTIKRMVKSQRHRYTWFLYRRPQVILPLAVIVVATASVSLLVAELTRGTANPGFSLVIILYLISPPAVIASLYAMRRFARSADEVRNRSSAPPIVLLRSFADDKGLKLPISSGYSDWGFPASARNHSRRR